MLKGGAFPCCCVSLPDNFLLIPLATIKKEKLMMKKWLVVAVSVACMLLMPFMVQADFGDEIKILDTGTTLNSSMGWVVAIDGDRAIAGDAYTRGSVVFAERDGAGAWSTVFGVYIANVRFGQTLAISGDYAVISAQTGDDVDLSLTDSGYVNVYVRDTVTGDWSFQQKLTASDPASNDYFGGGVTISGDTIIVGARGSGTKGAAYVYVRDAGGGWTEQAKLESSYTFVSALGGSAALDGDRAIIGSPSNGVACVFERTGTTWAEVDYLVASNSTFGTYFGGKVDVSGDYAIVGTDYGDTACIFERDATGTWAEKQLIDCTAAWPGCQDFGDAVTIDGDNAAVGAPHDTTGGSVLSWVRDADSGNWIEQTRLVASDAATDDNFGFALSMSGDTLMVGAPNVGINNTGAVYMYTAGGVVLDTPNIYVTDTIAPTDDLQILFGEVTSGTTTDQTITVANNGTADLVLGDVAVANPLDAPFSLLNNNCSTSLTLTPGASCTFGVRFAPLTAGAVFDSLDIPSNDLNGSVTVVLHGTGVVTTVPDITVSTLAHDFGSVTVGTTSDTLVTVTSNGTADLELGTLADADQLAAPFSIQNDTCSGQILAPAASCTFSLSFSPTATGAFSDSLDVPSNDPDENPVTVSMSGTGVAATVPDITVSPLVQAFGSVTVGAASETTVTLVNDGNADLVLGTIATANPLAAPFNILIDNCSGSTLDPAANCTFDVSFSPTATGAFSDSLDVPSNDPDENPVTVSMSGTGVAATVPDITVIDTMTVPNDLQIPFGNVTEGTTLSQTVTVSNDGSADLVVGDIAASNPLETPFSLQDDICSGLTLAPTASCTFDISYSPVVSGVFVDSFDIPSNDPDEDSITVSVSGTGLSAAGNNPPDTPRLVFPANGQQNVATTMTLQWREVTDPDGDPVSYQVFICEDSDPFNNCDSVLVTSLDPLGGNVASPDNVFLAGISGAWLLLFGIALVSRTGGRKRLVLLIAMMIIAGGLLASCGDSDYSIQTFDVSGLNSDAQYYWGVVADDGQGGQAQSEVWSFTTN